MIPRTAHQLPLLLALVLVLALAPIAFAAKGGGGAGGAGGAGGGKPGGGSGSLTLVLVSTTSTDGLPHYGDTVRFNVVDPATAEPHVQLQCFQGTTLVYTSVTGYYASYPWPWTQEMTLSTAAWAGGGASCTATLYHFTAKGTATDGTLKFTVYA